MSIEKVRVSLLSREEFIDKFIQSNKKLVITYGESIIETEKQIEAVKNDFESKPREIEKIKEAIHDHLKFGAGNKKINEDTEFLKKFEAVYGTDSLLDHLSQLKEWLEKYKKWKKETEDTLDVIDKSSTKLT